MSQTKRLALMAGVAVGMSSLALAQNANLDQSRAYAAELMGDAQGRTSTLAAQPADFTTEVDGLIKFRYNANFRDEAPAGDEDVTIGFQTARTRIAVHGNVGNENWGYFVQGEFDHDTPGAFHLLDAYGTVRTENDMQFMFGQFKLPLLRETLVDDGMLLAADRSPMESVFGQGRSQGVQLGSTAENWRFAVAFSDGLATANTDFTSPAEADFALTGRAEFKFGGAWSQFDDFTSFPNGPAAGMVGVAGHWQTGGDTGGPTVDVDIWVLTADVSWEGAGWNVFAAGTWANTDFAGTPSTDTFGALIQGGVFIAPQTELFGRWDAVLPDDAFAPMDSDFHTVTAGVNHYFFPDSHAVKFTFDVTWFLDNPSESIVAPNTLVGLLPDTADDQFNLRAQLQLLF